MNLAVVHSRAELGVEAPEVIVETHLAGGLPATAIVGLPELAVRESRDRVRAAIYNAGFDYPARKITINLAPADLPKDGGRFDLAIALGILAASGQIPPAALEAVEVYGELALSGELRGIQGILPAVIRGYQRGRRLIVPTANAAEAALVEGADVRAADTLLAVAAELRGERRLPAAQPAAAQIGIALPDLADVRGQPQARRALEVAAAGAHNLIFVGPPGTGKTMLASRLAGILPPLEQGQALEVAAVWSVAGHAAASLGQLAARTRPTRAPHHSASAVALVGGGSHPRPGEISLAHHGVLFLDELPEFDRHVLEVLREPLESGRILISRAARQAEFPARFQLIAAMNPCPCGYAGDPSGRCRCSMDAIARYRGRISGPLLDRIDLHVEVPRLPEQLLMAGTVSAESSAAVLARVKRARALAVQRSGKPNAALGTREIEHHCRLGDSERELLERAIARLGLSARGYHRVLRVARSIADLDESANIGTPHLAEALGYRRLDRGTPVAATAAGA